MQNIIDRNIKPAFKAIEKIEFIEAQKVKLRNNIPVYSFKCRNSRDC